LEESLKSITLRFGDQALQLNVEGMSITAREILKVISDINKRKSEHFLVKVPTGLAPNLPIGIDSLAFALNVKAEDLESIINEMISFNILELVSEKAQFRSSRRGWKKIRLKE
jgi:hypothetical protein